MNERGLREVPFDIAILICIDSNLIMASTYEESGYFGLLSERFWMTFISKSTVSFQKTGSCRNHPFIPDKSVGSLEIVAQLINERDYMLFFYDLVSLQSGRCCQIANEPFRTMQTCIIVQGLATCLMNNYFKADIITPGFHANVNIYEANWTETTQTQLFASIHQIPTNYYVVFSQKSSAYLS